MYPVAPGIFRGPQPKDENEFLFLHNCNVRTILDLENEYGEAEWEADLCKVAGVAFRSVPLSAWLTPDPEVVRDILSYLANPAHHPILVHCKHGQDRTGLAVALYRISVQGWSKSEAWKEMREHGFHRVCIELYLYFWAY